MIKILKIDTSGKVPFPETHNPTLEKLIELPTQGGSSLREQFPELTIEVFDVRNSPKGLVDYFVVGLLNIVSTKLKSVFESTNSELEYYPVKIAYNGNLILNQYFVAHPLNLIQAIDLNRSDIELEEEFPIAISAKNLVIDEEKFAGINLAVIGELQMIGVQSNVAYAIEQSGCTGCVFVNPETIKF